MKKCSGEQQLTVSGADSCDSGVRRGHPNNPTRQPNTYHSPKKVYITNVGCVENALAAADLSSLFERNKWHFAKNAKDADLVVVNTCGMSDAREKNSLDVINKMCSKTNDPAKVIVTGCLTKINPDSIQRQCRGTCVISPNDYTPLERMLNSSVQSQDASADAVPAHFLRRRLRNLNMVGRCLTLCDRIGVPYPPYWKRVFNAFEKAEWHYVHICKGCIYRCSYCAIRFAKGRIKSRPPEVIVAKVLKGIARGKNRIVLVGDDTGSYGMDIGLSLGELLCRLAELPGDFKIHVRNLHPMGLLRQKSLIKKAVATGKIRALTIPIQTASDRLLHKMRRHHDVAGLIKALREISEQDPSLLLLTHILVGFPGESRAEFKATLKLIKDFPFDGVAPDCFSPRKGTEAFDSPDQIPESVKRLRYLQSIGTIIFRVYLNSLRWKRTAAAEVRMNLSNRANPVKHS